MDQPKRPSGGKRATMAKQRRREEAERRAIAAGVVPPPLAVPPPREAPPDVSDASAWLLIKLIKLGIAAENDAGLEPPSQRREAREHYTAAGKLVDASKLRVELDELLALMDRRPTNASQVDGSEDSGGSPPTRQ